MSAQGGGDGPEAVADGIHEALVSFPWSKSAIKICVLIADAPPHGLSKFQGDGFPPQWDQHDPMVDMNLMLQQEIILYSVGCEPALGQTPFARDWFKAIAEITGGRYLSLQNAELLPQVIIGGADEEADLEKNAALIEAEIISIRAEMVAADKPIDEDQVYEIAAKRMADKGMKTTQGKLSDIGVGEAQTPYAGRISLLKTLKEVKEMLDQETPPAAAAPTMSSYSRTSSRERAPRSAMSDMFGGSAAPAQGYSLDSDSISKEQIKRVAWRKKY